MNFDTSNILDYCVPDSYLLSLLNESGDKGKTKDVPKRSRKKQQYTHDVLFLISYFNHLSIPLVVAT